jgi:hypothetical protein
MQRIVSEEVWLAFDPLSAALADGIGARAHTLQVQARRDGRSLLRLCDD